LAESVPDPSDLPRVFHLREVTARLRKILLPTMQKEFWVRAQFVPDRTRKAGGHCYGHLVETDETGAEIAKLRVTIWKRDLERIEAVLRKRGEDRIEPLRTGGEICAKCALRFHEVYGLSLTIFEVDPDFGESQLDRNRRTILENLRQQGLLEQNQGVPLSMIPLRIGLVTATDSAAYADFLRTLLATRYSFQVVHVGAVMQGRTTASSIIAGLQRLERESLDLICVIRGGGSPLDLAGMDDEQLALSVARCKYPVWVGVGHEIDTCVLDHVAHTSHKTPTAVAEALVSRIRQVDDRLQQAHERLSETVHRRQDLAEKEIQFRANGLSQGTRKQLQFQTERFGRYVSHLETLLTEQAARHEGRFERSVTTLRERTRSHLERAIEKLDGAEGVIQQNADQRLRESEKVLSRARLGLHEGVRKHISWIQERLHRRSERVHDTIRLQTDRKLSILDHSRQRLRTASTNQVRQAEESYTDYRASVPLAFQNRLVRSSEKLSWLARSLTKIIPYHRATGGRTPKMEGTSPVPEL